MLSCFTDTKQKHLLREITLYNSDHNNRYYYNVYYQLCYRYNFDVSNGPQPGSRNKWLSFLKT